MRKGVVIFIFISIASLFVSGVIAPSHPVEIEESKCVDSDGGRNYYVKGSIDGNKSYTDSCTYCNGLCLDDNPGCDSSCGGLIEYYCENNEVKKEIKECECGDGVCLNDFNDERGEKDGEDNDEDKEDKDNDEDESGQDRENESGKDGSVSCSGCFVDEKCYQIGYRK